MIRVGVTGSVAAGKSSVTAIFAEHGAKIIDADEIVIRLEAKDAPGYKAIVAHFGDGYLAPDGEIDRRALGALVFSDDRARRDLELIIHPLVEDLIYQDLEDGAAEGCAVAVLDIPLLVEVNGRELYDLHGVLVVDAPREAQLARLAGRGLSEQDAKRRLAAHPPSDERLAAADYIILNSAGPTELREMAERAWTWALGLGEGLQ